MIDIYTKYLYNCVEVSNDERTQSRDGCRCRGECRTGDAETRGRAEPETRGRAEPEEQRRETRAEQRRRGAEVQRRKGADVQRRKGENRQSFVRKKKTLAGTLARSVPI